MSVFDRPLKIEKEEDVKRFLEALAGPPSKPISNEVYDDKAQSRAEKIIDELRDKVEGKRNKKNN